jgi:hypothetical protein
MHTLSGIIGLTKPETMTLQQPVAAPCIANRHQIQPVHRPGGRPPFYAIGATGILATDLSMAISLALALDPGLS